MAQDAAVRVLEDAAGFRDPDVGAAVRRAEQLTELLEPSERSAAAAARQGGGQAAWSVLERVAAAFTEDLEVYAQPGSVSRVQSWDDGGVAMLPTLGTAPSVSG